MTPYDSTTPDKDSAITPQQESTERRPSREDAEKAVELLLRWAGDDPSREGLVDTPARVARAYEEFFSGYQEDPEDMLARTFEEVEGYDDMVMLRGIDLQSHCEHHVVPIQTGAYSLSARSSSCWHIQASPCSGQLWQTPADTGNNDSTGHDSERLAKSVAILVDAASVHDDKVKSRAYRWSPLSLPDSSRTMLNYAIVSISISADSLTGHLVKTRL